MNIQKKPLVNKSWLLIATIALFGIVIYAGNVMTINTSKITDIICLASFTFMPISSIVCAICFLIPLHSGITGVYIYGYAALMILFKSKKFKVKVFLPLLVIIMYELIMMMLVEASQFNYVIVYAVTVFLLLYIMNTEEVDPKVACVSYICGTFVLLACVFTTAIQNYSLEAVLEGAVRIGEYEGTEHVGRIAVVTENANAMAYYALVAIVIALNIMEKMKSYGKALLIAAIMFFTFVALFTVSRTFVIVLIAFLILNYLTTFKSKQKLTFLAVVIIALAIFIPYLQQRTQIFDAFTTRFEDDNLVTGAGRVDIFFDYMKFLWDNPMRLIFGTGAVFYKNVCKLSHSMHNGLQQIFVSYGALGFIPMVGILVNPILDFFKNNRFKIAKILPVLAVVLFTQTIQFLNPNNLMLPYAVAILCMKIPDTEVTR